MANQIETIRYVKQFLKVSIHTSSILARGELGRFPLWITCLTRCFKNWLKLARTEDFRYQKQCYLVLKNLNDCNRITWATSVETY